LSQRVPQRITLAIRRPLPGENPKATPTDYLAIVGTEELVDKEVRAQFDSAGSPSAAVVEIRDRLNRQLQEYMSRAAGVMRWQGDLDCEDLIRRAEHLQWSDEGKEWHTLRAPPQPDIMLGAKIIRELAPDSVAELMKTNEKEPLAHELLCEAWSIRTKSPRSALLVGVAAAEVGFKAFVATLVPDAAWLAFEAPTPPLDKMLVNFFPDLPVRQVFGVKPFIPKALRKALSDAVGLRNKVAHAGADAPQPKELWDILGSVSDLLYLLDTYLGCNWAWYHLRNEIREEIVAAVERQKEER
jgi:hypothetical protein